MNPDKTPPLDRWLPRLLQVWRGTAGAEGLTSAEADQIALGVRELSQGLTGSRALAGQGYLGADEQRGDANLLGAYLLYYWPVSFAQTLSALRKGDLRRGKMALDLGSGPAPGAMALFEAGWPAVTAADRSTAALAQARQLAQLGGHTLTTEVWHAESGQLPRGGPWDLILLGHFVNELAAGQPDRLQRRVAFFAALKAQLAPGGSVLMIEPAAHGPNAEALALRDELVKTGWGVQGPCFYQSACPALAAGAACHDLLPWKVPHLVAQTARRAGIDKRELPFTWLAFRADAVAPAPKYGRWRVLVCGEKGRFSLSAPGSFRSPLWLGLRRGDALTITDPETRETGWGIGPATKLGRA